MSAPARTIEQPVFLIGSERSGTTLLRLMLDHHPDIAFNLESEFLVSDISDTGDFPDVAAYRKSLSESRVFRHSHFQIPENLEFPALVNDFLRQKRDRDGKRLVGATVHYGFSKLRYLWPGAKYIYLLRDGRDVAQSVVEMGWAGNVYAAAKWWLDAEQEWGEYRKSLTRDRWIEIRYEELVANCQGQLRHICDFLGVNYSERMFDYTRDTSYSLPDFAQAFKWRRKARPRDLRLLEARIGSQLVARGYELGCKTPARIGRIRAKLIQLRSRVGVVRRKIALIGLGLYALEIISRRCGWTSIQRNAQRRIDAIIDRNLK